MRKRIISIMLTATMLALAIYTSGCSNNTKSQDDAVKAESSAETTVAQTTQDVDESTSDNSDKNQEDKNVSNDTDDHIITGGSPWLDTDFKENMLSIETYSEKDDFAAFVNHEWSKNNEIETGSSSYSAFNEVANEMKKNVIDTIKDDNLSSHESMLVKNIYNAYLDWDARDKVGLEPLQVIIDDINNVKNIDEMNDFITSPEKSIFSPTFAFPQMNVDFIDSSRYVPAVTTVDFIFPDTAYYKDGNMNGKPYEEAYKTFTTKVLTRLGYTEDEIVKICEDTLGFERMVADSTSTNDEKLSPDYYSKILNYYTLDEVQDLLGNVPFKDIVKIYGFEASDKYLVTEPEQLKKIAELYVDENIEEIKNYMIFKTVNSMGEMLDKETYLASNDKVNSINGSTGMEPYEELAYSFIKTFLSEPLQMMYFEKHDVSKMKNDITEICYEVIDNYRTMLEKVDWLGDDTKKQAIAKLDNLKVNVIKPDKFHDYSGLSFDGLSYVEMRKALTLYSIKLQSQLVNQKVDNDYWVFNTLDTNSFYLASNNSMNILLGIIGGAFYNENMSVEELYGSMGTIIGHEISHAFDTKGSQFDMNGNFAVWWTDEDYASFKGRTQKLIDYYSNIVTFGDEHVIGENVQTEAIADIAGMKVMLAMAKNVENFDYDKFFKSYAEHWCTINNYTYEYNLLHLNEHPLDYIRVNTVVQQFDEFLETYDIKETDNMYLAPEDRISVW